jgi:hypothetical protein
MGVRESSKFSEIASLGKEELFSHGRGNKHLRCRQFFIEIETKVRRKDYFIVQYTLKNLNIGIVIVRIFLPQFLRIKKTVCDQPYVFQAVGDSVKKESGKDFMLDAKYGFIHACPTNLGTGTVFRHSIPRFHLMFTPGFLTRWWISLVLLLSVLDGKTALHQHRVFEQ